MIEINLMSEIYLDVYMKWYPLFDKCYRIEGEFLAWDNCTSIGISVIFYPCKQIKLC